MANATDGSGPEEWTEPFKIMGNARSLSPIFIVAAVKQRLLSVQAIQGVACLMSEESDPWGCESGDFFENGTEVTMRALSLRLLEQTYKLASGQFDEPQSCMYALQLLVACLDKPSSRQGAIDILSNLVASDSLAGAKLSLVTTEYGSHSVTAEYGSHYQLQIPRSAFIKHMLADFRVFVRRKMHDSAESIARHFLSREAFGDGLDGSVEDSLELAYLIVEHLMSSSQFERVPLFSDTISQVLDASTGRDVLETSRRRLQISLARAFEALGDLETAAGIYTDHQQPEGNHLTRILTEGSPFWAHKSNYLLGAVEGGSRKILGAREMQDGSVAVFMSSTSIEKTQTLFFLRSPDGELVRKDLPHNGARWKTVKVVPNKAVDPLLVLVAPHEETEDWDPISSMMMLIGNEDHPHPLIQLWEYDGTNLWKEIQTRGDVPDRRSLTMVGSDGTMLNQKFVLFGGMSPFPVRSSSGEQHNPSSVSILCLESKEWLRVPHPYESSYMMDQQGRPAGPTVRTLPPFSTMSTCQYNDSGDEMIVLLRKGKALTVEKRGNELVPKYAIDLFEEALEPPVHHYSSSVRRPCNWGLNIPTSDKSGYIADHIHPESVNIADSLLVLSGMGGICHIQRLVSPGSASSRLDFPSGQKSEVRSDLLDLKTMEWRSLAIHNAWMLGSDVNSGKLLASSQSDLCYFITIDERRLRFLCLHNASSIKMCVEKAISEKKLKSKKNTLSYQLKKGTQHTVQPMHSCTFCGTFEAPGVTPFKCCARCRVPFYCSRECQISHWKKKGGNHKALCSPNPKEGPAL